jgi:integrase
VRRLDQQLGLIRITSLTPQVIQDAYRCLQDGGLTAYSVLQTHRTLSRALTQAFHWGVIPRNPATLVFPPRPQKREMTALNPQELLRLFDHTRGERLQAMWVLLGTSGLRLGEALGLGWEDLDLVAGRLVVRRTLQRRRRAGLVFGTPKTPTSRRTVLLCGLAVQALRVHRSRQGQLRAAADNWCDSGLVFTNTTGGPLEPSFALHDLHRSLDRAGLPRIRVHDLRHTTASLLLVAEVHPKIVQDMLGHSTVLTTLDTYSHVMPTLQAEAIRRLDFLLAGIQLPTGPPSADTIGTSRPVAA